MGSTLHPAARREIMNPRDLLSVVDFDQLVEVKNAIRNVETAVEQVAVELNKLLAKIGNQASESQEGAQGQDQEDGSGHLASSRRSLGLRQLKKSSAEPIKQTWWARRCTSAA
jgi:hypothetical protein